MGQDICNILPSKTKKSDIVEFIKLLGYSGKNDLFHFFKDDNFKHYEYILLGIDIPESGESVNVSTRTSIWCSEHDLDYQNFTARQIRKRFGGYFISDIGRNRYFPISEQKTSGAENGVYLAYAGIHNKFACAFMFVDRIEISEPDKLLGIISHSETPFTLSTNIILTYISSIIENYFRNTYIALLTYSSKIDSIVKKTKIYDDYLVEVCSGSKSIFEAIAFSKSFQNMGKVCDNFKEIDAKLNIHTALSKPYRKRNESLFDTINRVLEQRHSMIHRLDFDIEYDKEKAKKDIESVKTALTCVYEYIVDFYQWNKQD